MNRHVTAAPPHWHAMHRDEVAARLDVDTVRGLSHEEAERRLARWGLNRPMPRRDSGPARRLLAQLTQPMVLVLIAAGLVTAFLGQWVDALVIFGVVLVNAAIGFIQEGRAEAALAALGRALQTQATVLRAGQRQRVDAARLVPGDIVALAAGDRVPADVRLLAPRELRAAEAMLTGESDAVAKHGDALPPDTQLADRRNMSYGGTLVVAGQSMGVVVATGDATETGRIAGLIAEAPQLATPLTRRINALSRQLLFAILGLAAVTFVVGLARGGAPFDMFMAAVALGVSAIPEGLPAAMTVVLAIGVGHMARRRAIVRRLPAVETLGSTTVICSDKTGTLTENAMTVREVWAGGESFHVSGNGYSPAGRIASAGRQDGPPALVQGALGETLIAGALCNDARLVHQANQWTVEGDPTEAALLVVARKGGLDERTLVLLHPRCEELPFDSRRQAMATSHQAGDARIVYVKGAVEKLLPACAAMLAADGREIKLDAGQVQAQALRMSRAGLRVLALASRSAGRDEALLEDHLSAGLVFLGLVGMMDPPRARSVSAVRACHAAGIRVKMITGDHAATALAIASQLGIAQERTRALSGSEIAAMDDDALRRAADEVDVFARVAPEQKLRLVRALQANGEIVAMTGDGVNDAPALKQADIGVAMGLGGTEVAKEAADIVLVDDNFATIEAAVEEGRGILDNLLKFIVWTLPANAGEGLVVLTAVLAGWTLPMTPLQILWNNMASAIFLGVMLAFEPTERGVMQRPPRPPAAQILDAGLLRRTLLVSAFMVAGAFGLFELALRQGQSLEQARTVVCNLFIVIETLYLFNCRSLSRPFWTLGPFANPWAWVGAGGVAAAQLAFTHAPFFNRVFHTAPIDAVQWLGVLVVGVACAASVELQKRHDRPVRASRRTLDTGTGAFMRNP